MTSSPAHHESAHSRETATPGEPGATDQAQTVMFGADWCGDCRRAKLVFERAGVAYRYVDLVQDPDAAEVARDISGRTNIPVILYPDASHQVEPSNADLQRKIDELGLGRG